MSLFEMREMRALNEVSRVLYDRNLCEQLSRHGQVMSASMLAAGGHTL